MALVPIRELIDDTMEANAAYAAQFVVTFKVPQTIPDLAVSADYQRLVQVMANLLSNASKYSADGGHVAISVEQTDGIATIAVRDWSSGIPEECHDVIFEKFPKLSSPANLTVSGTGLGLNICQSIINRHDGEIGFVSKPGEGSTFYFKLPVI